jgi:DNA-binding SARP family transcriptional activator
MLPVFGETTGNGRAMPVMCGEVVTLVATLTQRIASDEQPLLRLVGGFAVMCAGTELPDSGVGNRKARTLLAMLAVEAGRSLSMERIAGGLWAGKRPLDPAHNIATLVSRLRRLLGRDVVAKDRVGYRLGSRLRVDLNDAAALVERAEDHADDNRFALAVTTARDALSVLDNGGVLDDHPGADWAEPARVRHGVLVRRARLVLADAALRLGELRAAEVAAARAVATDPLDEVACRLLMLAYEATGDTARALNAYQRLRVALADELGADPGRLTQELHVAIMQGQHGPASRGRI